MHHREGSSPLYGGKTLPRSVVLLEKVVMMNKDGERMAKPDDGSIASNVTTEDDVEEVMNVESESSPSVQLTPEQDDAYEKAVNLLVDLLGEVEVLSPVEESVLEQAVSDSLYLRGDDTSFDDVLAWLGSSEIEVAKGLSRLLGMVKKSTGGTLAGASFGLPHVGLFSTPWVNTSPVSFVTWEVTSFSDEDDTPVLRVGDDYAIVLTTPVAAKMYRALGEVLREVAPEEVRKPKKSWGQRVSGLSSWGKKHKYFAGASVIVVGMVVVGILYGFLHMSGSIIPA